MAEHVHHHTYELYHEPLGALKPVHRGLGFTELRLSGIQDRAYHYMGLDEFRPVSMGAYTTLVGVPTTGVSIGTGSWLWQIPNALAAAGFAADAYLDRKGMQYHQQVWKKPDFVMLPGNFVHHWDINRDPATATLHGDRPEFEGIIGVPGYRNHLTDPYRATKFMLGHFATRSAYSGKMYDDRPDDELFLTPAWPSLKRIAALQAVDEAEQGTHLALSELPLVSNADWRLDSPKVRRRNSEIVDALHLVSEHFVTALAVHLRQEIVEFTGTTVTAAGALLLAESTDWIDETPSYRTVKQAQSLLGELRETAEA
ncbi:MAG TPA: hypothetical protein VD735_00585 [Candidatus Saccharimonadales bacterium]|nr:hypothetical protein [Candidatus Saccharimonadales bacterium]